MAIYGRFGDKVKIVRIGTLEDVKKLDGRKPDKQDREAVKTGSYVVVEQDDGRKRLYHLAYIRADNGAREVSDVIRTVAPPEWLTEHGYA